MNFNVANKSILSFSFLYYEIWRLCFAKTIHARKEECSQSRSLQTTLEISRSLKEMSKMHEIILGEQSFQATQLYSKSIYFLIHTLAFPYLMMNSPKEKRHFIVALLLSFIIMRYIKSEAKGKNT